MSNAPTTRTRSAVADGPSDSRDTATTATAHFTIGAEAVCTDGSCGTVSMVVVDPVARAVTHLVVEPGHSGELARLVPLSLVDASNGGIRLGCSQAIFGTLEAAERSMFLPGDGRAGYRADQQLSWPYYGLSAGAGLGLGLGVGGSMGFGVGSQALPEECDVIPPGEVAIRRGDRVHTTDGEVGRVQGVVIDTHDHRVTHVLLQEGHFWGRKQVAVPSTVVSGMRGGLQLTITKQAVGELPPVDLDPWTEIAHPGEQSGTDDPPCSEESPWDRTPAAS